MISVIYPPEIIRSPEDITITYYENAGFSVLASGIDLTYQWQIKVGNSFIDLSDNEMYSGVTTDSLHITKPPVSMSGTIYRVIVSDYCIPAAISDEAELTVLPLELIVIAQGINKIYDGNTLADISLQDNRKSWDRLIVEYSTATFETPISGRGILIDVRGITVRGEDAGNYTFNTSTVTWADIIPREIKANFIAEDKVYDGNTSATITDHSLNGVLPFDTTEVNLDFKSAMFADKNVGENKLVIPSELNLSGDAAINYYLGNSGMAHANITPKPIIIAVVADTKVYDGTTRARIRRYSLNGAIRGDKVR